jgi:GcrA cell cycle regulator
MEWTDDTIVRLRDLWAQGLSTAEIGRRLGVSKNAVVGKAHRLNLPARPSPIRRDESGAAAARRRAPRRVSGPTLPPLASIQPGGSPSPLASGIAGFRVLSASLEARAEPAAPIRPEAAPPLSVPRPAVVARTAGGRRNACCWPIGEPGTPAFRFCDADSMPGKPYCDEHARLAYVKVRDRHEDAA